MILRKYLLLILCLPCFVQAKNITISRLTCEMQEGLVVVEGVPRLGWVMESPENGTQQSAYEIDIREVFYRSFCVEQWKSKLFTEPVGIH